MDAYMYINICDDSCDIAKTFIKCCSSCAYDKKNLMWRYENI